MHVQHALGFPRGAAGVENVERVLSVHHLWGTLDALTSTNSWKSSSRAVRSSTCGVWRRCTINLLDIVQATHRFVSDRLQVDRSTTAVCHIRGHDDFRRGRPQCGCVSAPALKPAYTTLWIAPMRAQASMAVTPSMVRGM